MAKSGVRARMIVRPAFHTVTFRGTGRGPEGTITFEADVYGLAVPHNPTPEELEDAVESARRYWSQLDWRTVEVALDTESIHVHAVDCGGECGGLSGVPYSEGVVRPAKTESRPAKED